MSFGLIIFLSIFVVVIFLLLSTGSSIAKSKENEQKSLDILERENIKVKTNYLQAVRLSVEIKKRNEKLSNSYKIFLTVNEGNLKYFSHEEFTNRNYLSYCNEEVKNRKAITVILGLKSIGITNEEFEEILINITAEDKKRNDDVERKNLYNKARSLEDIDNLEAIKIYQKLQNISQYDALDRLIILYRKTHQKELEIQAIEWLIEEEQNKEYNRMSFLSMKFPDDAAKIRNCYDNNETYINPLGVPINFHSKINRLKNRINNFI
ncbi:hypothetical protein [Epilithonimonas xixisoli]|uniref:Uncharacterized protein n=1 Tax=Epilithonimonas xixisoli TaxID=1476462 RepID=A0A4R8I6F2_9FLAO|nr:hypothetical protein [Epilithonimonas xixisoli]TDX83935.1 hypothetical protein B0I22_1523 [Epilithonimonas xixisoli]